MKRPPETLFAANVPYSFTDEQLGELFDPYGLVISARVARDKATGQSKGFGFVELAPEKARAKAIEGLNGKTVEGRKLEVRIADTPEKPAKPARRPRLTAKPAPYVGDAAYSTPVAARPKRSVLVEYRNLSARRLRGVG
jgi:RNA recognition motif-containing protein